MWSGFGDPSEHLVVQFILSPNSYLDEPGLQVAPGSGLGLLWRSAKRSHVWGGVVRHELTEGGDSAYHAWFRLGLDAQRLGQGSLFTFASAGLSLDFVWSADFEYPFVPRFFPFEPIGVPLAIYARGGVGVCLDRFVLTFEGWAGAAALVQYDSNFASLTEATLAIAAGWTL